MGDITTKVEELIQTVKQGDTYQKYLKAMNALNEDEELKRQVDDLRSRNFKLQNDGLPESIFEESSKLEIEFYELRKNPVASEFLDAELVLCKMLKGIGIKIHGEMDINLPH